MPAAAVNDDRHRVERRPGLLMANELAHHALCHQPVLWQPAQIQPGLPGQLQGGLGDAQIFPCLLIANH